jgi:hypothetical protein
MHYNISIILEIISSFCLNIGILFYALVLKGLDQENFNSEQSIYSFWMKIEVYSFYYYVFSSILFIFLAFFSKYRGYWIKRK